jgi:hypothetical protein
VIARARAGLWELCLVVPVLPAHLAVVVAWPTLHFGGGPGAVLGVLMLIAGLGVSILATLTPPDVGGAR